MVDRKHYVPELEEFHIGFEYEWLNDAGEWEKATPDEITSDKQEFIDQRYGLRVKHLDQEDIESLGWNYSGHTINQWYSTGEDVEFTLVKYNNNEVKITDKYPNGITQSDKEEKDIFRGSCKNKSELKRLMKQLGIPCISPTLGL